jgi:cell fate regulator YaaT (PSP1 superfamily)
LAVFGKPRYLGLVDIGNLEIGAVRWIVIETLRGLEMALLGGTLSREQEGKYRSACLDDSSDEHTRGPEPMLQEVRLVGPASESQIQEHGSRRLDEEAVLIRSRQILRGHQFQMKLVDVEYTMDRKKLFFYFTSDQRVDFRAYVRDLAKEFRIRIEMRQIGVRDEAKTVRGVSPCGRPCCCSYWLHRFTPINIRMVKEQNLALNPTKISGICGRLMCCMFYEHSTYSELWKNLPTPGSKIKTPQGNYVLEGVDLHTEMVRVGFPEGGEVPIPVAEFAVFKETIMRGEAWKKDEKKDADEPDRKGVSPRVTPRVALKPEKISIEEHIAERTVAEIESPPSEPLQEQTPRNQQLADASSAAKKRNRRRKEAPESRDTAGHGKGEQHRGREHHKPPEQRPKNEPAENAEKNAQGKTQAPAANMRGGGSRRLRHKGGNRGHERPGPGSAGSPGKGGS